MKIRSKVNGGVAEVSDEFGAKLIKAGDWTAADAPVAARKPRTKKAPVEEPQDEE